MSRLPALSAPLALAILIALSLAVLPVRNAAAGGPTFLVDTTDDDPTLDACVDVGPPDCSLRGAITLANNNPSVNTISLESGATYTLDETGAENGNETRDLDIAQPVIINVLGFDAAPIIDADGIDRVFEIDVNDTDQVQISGLVLKNGNETGGVGGGAVYIDSGKVSFSDVSIEDSDTTTNGGGIAASGDVDLEMSDSELLRNEAVMNGGGLYKGAGSGSVLLDEGEVDHNEAEIGGGLWLGEINTNELTDTDVTNNIAACLSPCGSGGGGVFVSPFGTANLTIDGGSVSHNSTGGSGGGIYAVNATINGTTIDGNSATSEKAGGFFGSGTIADATITNNSAAFGGGLVSLGPDLTISRSLIASNHASGSGGGLITIFDTTIDHSLIRDNTAGDAAGGIGFAQGDNLLINSTVDGNTAARGGGVAKLDNISSGIDEAAGDATPQGGAGPGDVVVSFSTIADNTGTSAGANLFFESGNGPMRIEASIVAFSNGSSDCNVPFATLDYNVEEGESCGFAAAHDIMGVDPMMEELGNNGGPTFTRALLNGSQAINRVPQIFCPISADDQRGEPRPQSAACDSGAFESSFTSTPGPTPTDSPSETPTPTPSPSGSPSPTLQPQTKIWADTDCGDDVDENDILVLLAHEAGLPDLPDCFPPVAQTVTVDGIERQWADIDCNGIVRPIDALRIFLLQMHLGPTLPDGCPDIGDEVVVTT